MLKRTVFLAIAVLGAMVLSGQVAQAAAGEASLKIGYVDMTEIMTKAPQVAAAQQALQREFNAREQALKRERQTIQQQENAFNKNSPAMSETEKKAEQKTLSREIDLHNQKVGTLEQELLKQRGKLAQAIRDQILVAISRVAKSGGYALILGDGVVYASDRANVTDRVLEQLKTTLH